MKVIAAEEGNFWNKKLSFVIEADAEIKELSDLPASDRVQRSEADFSALLQYLRAARPSIPLPDFPLNRPQLLCALLKFLCAHARIGWDPLFVAFLTVESFAVAQSCIKTEFSFVEVPRLEKLKLLFLGQVPIDSRFRKVERLVKDLGRLRRRLRRVEGVIDEMILIQGALKGDCESTAQFLTALRGQAFSVGAVYMDGLEEARTQLQLSKLLIEGIKSVVQNLNDFRKAIHLKRLEVAKVNERLERDDNGTEKPSFEAIYADKNELEEKAKELNELVKRYEEFGDAIIAELTRLRSSLQMSVQSTLFQVFK